MKQDDAYVMPLSLNQIRMEDIAKASGYSLATVSRAFNKPELLKSATRNKIFTVAKQLNYVPNLTAGSLASRRTKIVAAIVPTFSNSFFSETIEGLIESLAASGYQLLIGQSSYNREEEFSVIQAFLGRRVDGLILTGLDHSEQVENLLASIDIPVIRMWDFDATASHMMVGFSHIEVGKKAAQYLLKKGHVNCAFIGSNQSRSRQRFQGFSEHIMRVTGRRVAVAHTTPPSSIIEGAERFAELITVCPTLEAVFCGSDMVAAGVKYECSRREIRIPDELAIIGFSDQPIAHATAADLTTLKVDCYAIGNMVGDMLTACLKNEKLVSRHAKINIEVVVRGSA